MSHQRSPSPSPSRRKITHKPRRFAHRPSRSIQRRLRSPFAHQVLATRRIGGWTYALLNDHQRGYPPTARVGRTRRAPDAIRMFGLADEYRVFPASVGGVKEARRLYREVVGSSTPSATWTSMFTGGGRGAR